MGFGKVSTAFFTSALISPGDGTGHRGGHVSRYAAQFERG
jgi:hypothetical protein